jgi:hypothetical protein
VNIVSTSLPVTVAVSEPGYTGSFVVNGARCAGVATITAAGTTVGQYTVTGVAAGSCTITFTDTFLQAVVLPVVVTTTTGTITIG